MSGAIPNIFQSKSFIADKAWDALDIANMNGITTRLHWTDQPYNWHINEGEEVFVVLDGVVDMHYKINSEIKIATLNSGDIFHATVGTEHVAHPQGEARILVIESDGSM
jgi:mannose-6-phosphate isomerase-like protein (cupin superfamily)